MATHSSVLALENPRDGGAWWVAVYGVTQSRTRLKWERKGAPARTAALRLSVLLQTRRGPADAPLGSLAKPGSQRTFLWKPGLV